MRTMKHLALAAMAATALALAGCGGGGGGGTAGGPTTPTDPPTPAPTPAAVTLPSEGNMYLDTADTTLEDGTVSLAAGASTTLGAYMLSCSDAGPCEIMIADGEVMATGEVSAGYSAAAQADIDAAKKVAADENSGRSLGMHSALTDATGVRGEAIRGTTKADDLKYARGLSGGAMVSHSTVGWETADAGTSISGWAGKVVSKATQSYTVYTDIAAAKRKAYDKAYANDGTTTTVPTVLQIGTGDSPTNPIDGLSVAAAPTGNEDPPRGRLTLNNTAMAFAANAGLLDPSGFPQAPEPGKADKVYTYSLNTGDTSGTSGHFFKEFTGTFHGATGKYACTETGDNTCTVTVTAPSTVRGAVYSVTGGWTFTPDTKNNPQIIEQDTDHMRFGWWLNDPAKAAVGGEYLHDAQVFSGGNQAFPNGNIAALHGKVSYEGPAAGLYAVTGDAAAHGEFTATAKLTADFGAVTGDRGSVSGTIGSFMRDDGVANDWALTLSKADLAADATTGAGNIADGNKKIGGWSYALYGPGKANNNVPPTGIAGTFDAAIDKNTAVAGAFGAK